MSNKFYVVLKGKKTGIFKTWAETQKQVSGFKGAIFKSFLDEKEAQKYFSNNNNINDEILNNNNINEILNKDQSKGIYSFFIDGSFNKFTSKIGFGVVCHYGKIIFTFYQNLSDVNMAKFQDSLNVAGEIFGSLYVLNYALENNIRKVKIYFDYEGIEKWATKVWQAKSNIAIYYVNELEKYRDKIQILFQKVRAHSNIQYNEMADQLAKKAVN